jgi:hypothetical protein
MTRADTSSKLYIHNEMAALDLKNRDFYDSLDDQERKKFSTFLMIRWGSSVSGSSDMQAFYVQAINEQLNKHFFSISKHPKLQWLCATAASPGMGRQRHNWIAPSAKNKKANDKIKKLSEIFPLAKQSDLELLSQLNSDDDIEQYIKDSGN